MTSKKRVINQDNSKKRVFHQDNDVADKLFLLETKVRTLEILFREQDDIQQRTVEKKIGDSVSSLSTTDISFAEEEDLDLHAPDLKPVTPTRTPRSTPQSTPVSSPSRGRRSRSLFAQSTMLRPEYIRRPSIIEEELDHDDDYKDLSQDTFSLMILALPCSKQWWFGFCVFLLQFSLLVMIGIDQISSSKDSTPFDVPYKVDPIVHAGQLLAIVLSLATQTDLVMAIMTFMMLWTERRVYWTKLIKVAEDASLWIWISRIAFPIACEFLEGFFVLITTFVIVIQSSSIIDLFKDFAAMELISELDNMMFWLALHGYVGVELAAGAKQAKKIRIYDDVAKAYGGVPLRTIILLGVCFTMVSSWGYFAYGQISGNFFYLKYPKCIIDANEMLKMNNGICDGGSLNTVPCGFDDGDCITFNLGYPNCKISEPWKIGNGVCDQQYNDKDCLYDGEDCCALNANDFDAKDLYGDGKCQGGLFNTEVCEFDGGDCIAANAKYPDCPVLKLTDKMHLPNDPSNPFPALGNGVCDGGIFNNKECGWDDGDCLECNALVPNPIKIGDGYCDGGLYMDTPACNYDAHDCSSFISEFPQCKVPEPERIGNGHCDGFPYFSPDCGMDGDDCATCDVPYVSWIGDGICDGGDYVSLGCSLDGGDCSECVSHTNLTDASKIGDGVCDLELNTTACGWDGFDCLDEVKTIPCIVENIEWLGDGICDGGAYNSEACNYDKGDCLECNSQVPNITKIGDGYCDGGLYNELDACFEDGFDCAYFNDVYPNCFVPSPEKIGDGFCDGSVYFVEECDNDGGDCEGCDVENHWWIADGFCDGGEYLASSCSSDGGDCDECLAMGVDESKIGDGYCDAELNNTICGFDGQDCADSPVKCLVPVTSLLGDGSCDGGPYNTPACNFDNGDCIECNSKVSDPMRIGNGICDGGLFMTLDSCSNDGHDCDNFLNIYPNCAAPEPEKVGDGICHGGLYFTQACGRDGGDCRKCDVPDIEKVGDGVCQGGAYLVPECAMDGGDCAACFALTKMDARNIGDGYCDATLNITECGYDGSDCLGTNFCSVGRKNLLGDSFCDGGVYNTEICAYDNGDCLHCNAMVPDLSKIGDGHCDSGPYMDLTECYQDGQDCKLFLQKYPNCKVPDPEFVGDRFCNGGPYLVQECGWDGGDCEGCSVDDLSKIGNGICDGGDTVTEDCSIDGGDCDLCLDLTWTEPSHIGDGYCDVHLNITACNWDGGDCLGVSAACIVDDKDLLGDGVCNGGEYNVESCDWDSGDCVACNALVPEYQSIGDGYCDGGLYMQADECNEDGEDCSDFVHNYPDCNVDEPELIGDGHCDGMPYFTEECGMDGSDCEFCNVAMPALIGNGICNGVAYMSQGCSYDGGDCDQCLEETGTDPLNLGDGYCDQELNTTACGFDGGDCMMPSDFCDVEYEEYLGDGYCDGGEYNTEECGWDHGDCIECINLIDDPSLLGDGECNLDNNITECNYDAWDCLGYYNGYYDDNQYQDDDDYYY